MLSSRSILSITIASLLAVDAWVVGCGDSSFTGEPSEDGGSGDAQSSEAGGDGSPSADAGSYCATLGATPYFCADFDEGDFRNAYSDGHPGLFFTENTVTDGGTLGPQTDGESAPNALLSAIPHLDVAEVGSATAAAPLASTDMREHYKLDLDFRFDDIGSIPVGEGIGVFTLSFDNSVSAGTAYYRIAIVNGQLSFGLGDPTFTYHTLGALPPLDTWTHASIEINLAANDVRVAISGLAPLDIQAVGNPTFDKPHVVLGMLSAGGSDPITVEFDNVTLFADEASDGGTSIDGGDPGDGGNG